MTAALIACAHGTRSAEGQAVIRRLLSEIELIAPEGVSVHEAYVDVHGPFVGDVVAEVRVAASDIVIVPLLLSTGYHTEVDLVEAAGAHALLARALGPHPLLADILVERLGESGARPTDAVVLAAAGSTRAGAADDVDAVRALVSERWSGPVSAGFAAAMAPRIPEAVAAARRTNERVAAASYVLAPGYFAGLVRDAGADVAAEPLGADPRIAKIVWERWAEAQSRS